jgi:hypothetical protein
MSTDPSSSLADLFEKWGIYNALPKHTKSGSKEGFEPNSETATEYSEYGPNRFSVGDDKISQFFVGSFTVVGLFILYRFMSKK